MNPFNRWSGPALPLPNAGLRVGDHRRGLSRACLVASAALAAAIVGSLSAAEAAKATTFPGDNGRIGASGPISTHPDMANGSRLEIFTMRSKYTVSTSPGAGECKLTDNGNSDFNPRFSKDGRQVVFVRDNNLWTLRLDALNKNCVTAVGGTEKQLTFPVAPATVGADSFVGGWSPPDASSNSRVIFTRRTGSPLNFEVFCLGIDVNRNPIGSPVNVSNNSATSDSQPAWRPDGNAIVFTRNAAAGGKGKADIWEQPMSGCNPSGTPTNRAENTTDEESAATYAPRPVTLDGTDYQIVFQGDRDQLATDTGRNLEIYRTDAASPTGVKRLSFNKPSGDALTTGGALLDLTGFDLFPVWSPDAKRICFHSGRAPEVQWRLTASPGIIGQWELYTLDAVNGETGGSGGTASERLTSRQFNDERCGWQELPS